jgi:hypothetical protein
MLQRMLDTVGSESLFFQLQVQPHAPIGELLRRKRLREELVAGLRADESVRNAFLRLEFTAAAAASTSSLFVSSATHRKLEDEDFPEACQVTACDAEQGKPFLASQSDPSGPRPQTVEAVAPDSTAAVVAMAATSAPASSALAILLQKAKVVQGDPSTRNHSIPGAPSLMASAHPSALPNGGSSALLLQSSTALMPHYLEEHAARSTAAQAADGDDDDDFGPMLPLHCMQPAAAAATGSAAPAAAAAAMPRRQIHPSQMTREEFLAQQTRAPRRGESGYTPAEIEAASALGYVMSGSTNKVVQKYIDGLQKQLHERQAGKLKLEFLSERERRVDDSMVDACLSMMLMPKGSTPTASSNTSGGSGSAAGAPNAGDARSGAR